MRRAHRRSIGGRGAALVEAALVLPVFLTALFAIIEYGLLYASQSTAGHATRAGVRYAAANYAIAGNQTGAANSTRDRIVLNLQSRTKTDVPLELWIYQSTTTGTPTGDDFANCGTDCLRYTWNGHTFALQSGSWTDPDACGATIDSVGVYLTMRHTFVSGFFGSSITQSFHSVARLEPLPTQQCPAGAT